MSNSSDQKIMPHIWYAREAEEAARFYASIFPESRVDRVNTLPPIPRAEPPAQFRRRVHIVGQRFIAISAGPHDAFNDAISFR